MNGEIALPNYLWSDAHTSNFRVHSKAVDHIVDSTTVQIAQHQRKPLQCNPQNQYELDKNDLDEVYIKKSVNSYATLFDKIYNILEADPTALVGGKRMCGTPCTYVL